MEQKIDLKQIEGVLDELAKVKGSLITILQKTQETYGYLQKVKLWALQHFIPNFA